MFKRYQRRSFFLLALAAMQPAGAQTARPPDSDSVWDVLAQTAAQPPASTLPGAAAQPVRRPLGPIPGFTVPMDSTEIVDQSIFSRSKKGRHSIFGPFGEYIGRLQAATGTRVVLHGSSTFTFRAQNVTGDSSSYLDSQNLGTGNGNLYNSSRMDVDATFFDSIHYRTTFNNDAFSNRSDPNYNRVQVDYNTPKTRVQWGDLNVNFQGNSLIDFSRYLHGVDISHTWSRQFNTHVLYSQTKSETRTISIAGNGSSGPYYVYAGQIVDGSAQVRVNERVMKLGDEYTLDLYTGELRFLKGLVILPSDTVAISFETVGLNQNQGNIYGLRAEYAPLPGIHVGVTEMMQQTQGSGAATLRKQEFYGYNSPGASYVLDAPVDTTRPITVLVGGVPLVRNIDYIIDPNLTNVIRIQQTVPSTLIIQVQYIPLDTSPTPGNRSITGLDARFALGHFGSLTTEAAFSGLGLQSTNVGGSAYRIQADLTPLPKVHTSLTMRYITPTFSSIQSPGFNRNEKAVEFTGDYAPSDALHFNVNWQKAKRPSYSTGYGTNQYTVSSLGNDDYNQYGLSATYRFTRQGSLSLSRSSIGTDYLAGGSSKNLQDTLSLNYSGLRNVTMDAALSHNTSTTSTLSGTSTAALLSLYDNNSATMSKRLRVAWQPLSWVSLSSSVSDNDIKSVSGNTPSRSNARDTQFGAVFNLHRGLKLSYDYTLSDTGTLTTNTTGLVTGSGITAGGAGSTATSSVFGTQVGGGSNYNLGSYGNYSGLYGNGYNSGYGINSLGGRSASNRFGIAYTPNANLNLGVTLDTASSLGDNQFNSNRNNVAFQFGWQPSDRLRLDFDYSVQRVAYAGALGSSTSNTFQVAVSGRPFGGKLSMSVGWQSTLTNSSLNFSSVTTGSTTTTTDPNTGINSLYLDVNYPVGNRYSLFFKTQQSSATGSLGSTDGNTSFGLNYALTKTLQFSLGYQLVSRINKDAQYAAYNYKANSVLAQLGFNFR